MKRLLFATLLLLAVVPLQAQMRWGVRAGVTEGEPMIGTEVKFTSTGDAGDFTSVAVGVRF